MCLCPLTMQTKLHVCVILLSQETTRRHLKREGCQVSKSGHTEGKEHLVWRGVGRRIWTTYRYRARNCSRNVSDSSNQEGSSGHRELFGNPLGIRADLSKVRVGLVTGGAAASQLPRPKSRFPTFRRSRIFQATPAVTRAQEHVMRMTDL